MRVGDKSAEGLLYVLSAKGALSSCQKEDFCPRNTLKTRKGKKGTLNFRLFRVFSGQSFFPILLLFMPFAEKFAPHGINFGLEDIR